MLQGAESQSHYTHLPRQAWPRHERVKADTSKLGWEAKLRQEEEDINLEGVIDGGQFREEQRREPTFKNVYEAGLAKRVEVVWPEILRGYPHFKVREMGFCTA